MTLRLALFLTLATLLVSACQKQEEPPSPPSTTQSAEKPEPAVEATAGDEPPPAPPLREDFEGEPQLSLFPRVGDFCPEEDDKDGQALWLTYIDHLTRTSGLVRGKDSVAFAIRGIRNVDSVGFFSPLAVKPDTTYQVSFRTWAKLPEEGKGGAGILEFDEFLWIPGQYPKSLSDQHLQRAQTGVQLTGEHKGNMQKFNFRTGPKTRMIHLVFFREGTPSREPLVIDDIEIREE